MPFPSESFSYEGGCNCRSIRYHISIPEESSRPPNIYGTSAPPERLPMSAICHCNDCRRTHGQAIGFAVIHDLSWVSFSFQSQTGRQGERILATALFDPTTGPHEDLPVLRESTLKFYHSSPNRARGFCSHCGTPLCYFAFAPPEKLPEGWYPQLDIWAGTVDREFLEKEWLKPERELWTDFGLDWGMKMTKEGTGGIARCKRHKLEE